MLNLMLSHIEKDNILMLTRLTSAATLIWQTSSV